MKSYTGKTLEDLLQKVADEKNVAVEALTYYVTETKTGFLGIGASVTADVYASCDVEEFVFNYLDTFFKGLGMDVELEVSVNEGKVIANLNAENNAILIGKNGSSLSGLNLLLRNVVSSEFKRRFYVTVDINGYKDNRYHKLRDLAKRVAKTVQRTKVTASLDPMSNDERRVIHKELSGMAHIKTESEGQGRHRHLKVMYVESNEE
ncbi:protein jag [Erysipelothrix larvae]|uniref:Protein jag n=1 Tax=Erysipelothrix larvae TaxID=1514105 RepID=A0A0X8H228_9FIRM|nr:R3H domain-containing nucleic acid-binding protein [Erysipelothrix larvae]AMC94596.1 protein jag [Erysipelothrix larvae]